MAEQVGRRRLDPRVGLAIGAAIMLVAVGIVGYQNRWVRSAFRGPVPVTTADLRDLNNPDDLSNPWVTLTFDEAIDTGFVMENTKGGNTTQRSKYLLIRVGDRWLIADVPPDFSGKQVVGHLDRAWSPLGLKVVSHVKTRFGNRDILPYELNGTYDYRGQCFAFLGLVGALFLLGGYFVVLSAKNLRTLRRSAADDSRPAKRKRKRPKRGDNAEPGATADRGPGGDSE